MFDSGIQAISHEGEMRLTAGIRLVLALSVILVIWIDPTDSNRHAGLTYLTLMSYAVYCAVIYWLIMLRAPGRLSFRYWTHWADLGWYLVLVAFSSGMNGIFFLCFFFPIVVASFRWGLKLGLLTAFVAAILFTIVGYWTSRSDPSFQLSRFLLRPAFLLILGSAFAYRGNYEIVLHRRIGLLKDINTLSNPRFGVDRTIASNLERVRAFYAADSCLCLLMDRGTGGYFLRRVRRDDPDLMGQPEAVPEEMSRRLLAPAPSHAIVCLTEGFPFKFRRLYEHDIEEWGRVREDRKAADDLALLFDAPYFITVPIRYHEEIIGRLYLTAGRPVFRPSDTAFLIQAIEQIAPVIDSIKLVDRLALSAAEEERHKIARDIHDTVIQPYVGLQIGLSSLEQKLAEEAGSGETGKDPVGGQAGPVAARIRQLREMTEEGISDLRRYIGGLKAAGAEVDDFLPAIRRFAARFTEATGIAAHVEVEGAFRINGRLAAEVFQMVAEGLSNVQRHTRSAQATVRLGSSADKLFIRIENDGDRLPAASDFNPRSIAGRAAALQGKAHVEKLVTGGAAVVVEIPL